LEDDPGSVLKKTEDRCIGSAVYRLRDEPATEEVICGDGDRARDEHLPVSVGGEEGERSEDVEMGLDAPAREVDEQGAPEHLRDRNDMTRSHPSRPQD